MPVSSASGVRIGRVIYLALAASATPAGVVAQEGCALGEGSTLYVQEQVPGGGTISYFTKPHFECDDGVEIWADSAVAYSDLGMSHLMGAVRYFDRTRELRADTARYFSDLGRLQATGNVFVTDRADGSVIENGDLVYLRLTDFRDEESITVTTGSDGIRPRAVMTPAVPDSVPSDAALPGPYTVVGDRIVIHGGSYLTSVGDVEIERDSLFAFADSVEYDPAVDYLLLEGAARVVTDTNELVGRTITMGRPEAELSEIWARRDAVLTGQDLRLTSPQILIFLNDGALDRLVATPMARAGDAPPDTADLVRPVATVEDFELVADSLEVIAPHDVVERVFAVGNASTVSTARDSLNVDALPEIARSDWLKGDTVIVTFRQVGTNSTAVEASEGRRYEVESIVALGDASTLYRLTPSDTTARVGTDPPALHYVVGNRITITMVNGEVDGMDVVGQTHGVHLEPLVRTAAPDTLADTATVGTDTLWVTPDTTVTTPSRLVPARPDHGGSPTEPSTSQQEEFWRRE